MQIGSGNNYVTCPWTCRTYFICNKSLKRNNLSKVKSAYNGINYTPSPTPRPASCVYILCRFVFMCLVTWADLLAPGQSSQPPLLIEITNFHAIKIKMPFIFIWLIALKFVERKKSSSFIYKIHVIICLAAHFTAPWALPSGEMAPLAGVQFIRRLFGRQSQSAWSEKSENALVFAGNRTRVPR